MYEEVIIFSKLFISSKYSLLSCQRLKKKITHKRQKTCHDQFLIYKEPL